MKGKNIFTSSEIGQLKQLISLRVKSEPSKQKGIRDKMRKLGFYGEDDWGIRDMKLSDLDSLIKSGRIKVIGEPKPVLKPDLQQIIKVAVNKETSNIEDLSAILEVLKRNLFDPKQHSVNTLPDSPGNYLVCLREKVIFPQTSVKPEFMRFNGLNVIYTGIAGTSIRHHDYKTHFNGSAGRSTLRKSIGVLFGYGLIPRDKDPSTGKTKFCDADESKLTKWMHDNLVLFFYKTNDYNLLENKLIEHFNPPLNLLGCCSSINKEFRSMLSSLRSKKSIK